MQIRFGYDKQMPDKMKLRLNLESMFTEVKIKNYESIALAKDLEGALRSILKK
jgi:hypothetical protein